MSLRIVTHKESHTSSKTRGLDERLARTKKVADQTIRRYSSPAIVPKKVPSEREDCILKKMEKEETRVEEPAEAEYEFKPAVAKVSETKKLRDFGYGVPQWSPYFIPASYKPTPQVPCSLDYGAFGKTGKALDPTFQCRQNRANIKEMKGFAVIDHTWELLLSRPKCNDDLAFLEDAKAYAADEAQRIDSAHSSN